MLTTAVLLFNLSSQGGVAISYRDKILNCLFGITFGDRSIGVVSLTNAASSIKKSFNPHLLFIVMF